MATEQSLELATAVEAARRQVERSRLPPASLRTRFRTSLWVRRLLPTALMVRRAETRGRSLWAHSAKDRARALAAMEAVVGGTARSHEVEALAREHLVENKVREALFWQPWTTPALERKSAERMRGALSGSRGVLLSSCHVGPYLLGVSVIAALGRTPYSVAGTWLFDEPDPGYWGRRIARRRAEARARDERLIHAVNSFAVLRALLAEGEVVSVFFAIPGHRETHFLNKPVMLASGSARLAAQTDALILPIRTRRSGHRVWVDVCPPLDPRDFSGPEEIHDALAATHERSILEYPATIEDPNREGAWEQTASASAWLRPEPRGEPT
jgi:lauroyl/myristoyl acyltransferase